MSAAAPARPRKAQAQKKATPPYESRIEKNPDVFIRIDFRCFRHFPRLTDSGKVQLWILSFLFGETVSAERKKGTPAPEWSREMTMEEMAAAFGWRHDSLNSSREARLNSVTTKSIQTALDDLCDRGVVIRKKKGRGYIYRLPVETWDELPDYVPSRKPAKSSDSLDSEEETPENDGEEEAKDTGSVLPVFVRPIRIMAGKRSKPVEVPAAVEKLQVESSVEAEVDASVMSGILRVMVRPNGEYRAKDTGSRLPVSNPQPHKNKEIRKLETAVSRDNFGEFESTAIQAGLTFSSHDLTEARRIWSALSMDDKLRAVEGLRARVACGEYSDPSFRPLPQNYLRKRIFERDPRPAKASADRTRAELLEWAREIDERRRG